MNATAVNPFNITKAVDFSNQEINDYWVDIPSGAGFVALAKPTSPMPMLILGGKGSGKTHLMRYFSFSLQKIRYGHDLIGGIQNDKYIGIYLRCGGLNAARFRNKGQTGETWGDVFAYYMELWLSQMTLSTIIDALNGSPELEEREPEVVAELSSLIHLGNRESPNTLSGLNNLLRELQQELDGAINNSALTGTLPVHIAVTRGDLIFGIPRIVSENVPAIRECLFLYLIDEFENLSESQQKYINTLLRERVSPCSFKIGARMYGVRTFSTFSADEENKEGSEFEVLRLDTVLRENERYGEFARRLIAKRLAEFNHIHMEQSAVDAIAKTLDDAFEKPAKTRFSISDTAYVLDKYKGRERPYFRRLRQHLERGLESAVAPGLSSANDIEAVIQLLGCADFPLLEKVNIFLLYKEWSSRHNLLEAARIISDECRSHVNEVGNGRYQRTLEHFKADLLAQLYRDTDQRQRYLGLDAFIDISAGLPRNLLILLKHIYSWASFNGETPFKNSPISIRSQQAGVAEASEWFYKDARMMGRDGQLVMDSINRLGTLFRGIRFAEKPAECSCVTFSADISQSTKVSRHTLDVAQKWSLLLDVGGQRDRNTDRIDAKFQLNPMLAPRWDLPIYRRGVLALTADELNAIFDPAFSAEFEKLAGTRIARMSAPLFGDRSRNSEANPPQTASLFGEDEL